MSQATRSGIDDAEAAIQPRVSPCAPLRRPFATGIISILCAQEQRVRFFSGS